MSARFHDLTFVTDPGRVFSPRTTTEKLVDATLERVGVEQIEVWASDTCARALGLASLNAERLGARVHLVHGDLLDGLPRDLDVIVANLPYLAPETPGYEDEPAAAVFSSGDGLDHYRRLIAGAGDHLAPGGGMLIQFQGEVLEAERNELPWLLARLESLVAAAA
jgi:methylase of polypeptide subunit release factors